MVTNTKTRPQKRRKVTDWPFNFVAIIYNPNSTGSSSAKVRRLRDKLDRTLPAPVTLYETKHAGHAEELAHDSAMKFARPLIISVSGDGGYNEVINGAMQAKKEGATPICAVVPAGNANDHHRTLSKKPLRRAILSQAIHRIDLLKVTIYSSKKGKAVRYAHSYVGLGLTANVSLELNRQALNPVREIVIILRALYRFRPVSIQTEGNQLAIDSLIFSNINQMAKVLTVSKDGHPQDGMFELSIFPSDNKLRLIGRLLKAATIGLKPSLQTSQYEFTTIDKTVLHLDGEVLEAEKGSRVTITIDEKALPTIY